MCLPLQREIPTGLSERDIQILQSVRRSAHMLDKEFSICGLRFGWGFIISERSFCVISPLVLTASVCDAALIPGFGDFLNFFLNYSLIIIQAQRAEYVHLVPTR